MAQEKQSDHPKPPPIHWDRRPPGYPSLRDLANSLPPIVPLPPLLTAQQPQQEFNLPSPGPPPLPPKPPTLHALLQPPTPATPVMSSHPLLPPYPEELQPHIAISNHLTPSSPPPAYSDALGYIPHDPSPAQPVTTHHQEQSTQRNQSCCPCVCHIRTDSKKPANDATHTSAPSRNSQSLAPVPTPNSASTLIHASTCTSTPLVQTSAPGNQHTLPLAIMTVASSSTSSQNVHINAQDSRLESHITMIRFGKFYVVSKGLHIGIFESWPTASRFILGVPRAAYQMYRSNKEADEVFRKELVAGEVHILTSLGRVQQVVT
ncbi:hypothetical protein JAAARDRAFT_192297 [Jaapia argillacea MUCL 33604]|uniref:Ribonuclease H1 N-terminal domain-containing protein n=1 Tax=Jaapia argillacea MUCL 33604 TaxID=933084 RepID=A0A067Q134_9AGAM|nr:hypothetical protein JAAARDRAFT_192297 [Jaapia argillacea MUCL 33604]